MYSPLTFGFGRRRRTSRTYHTNPKVGFGLVDKIEKERQKRDRREKGAPPTKNMRVLLPLWSGTIFQKRELSTTWLDKKRARKRDIIT